MQPLPDRSLRPRRALAALVAAAFAALVALGPAHAAAHGGGAAHCATCHVVRHAPAVLAAAPALTVGLYVLPLADPPAKTPAPGVVVPSRSRGPPR